MPKSSSAIRTPRPCRSCSASTARPPSNTAVSVTSTTRRAAGRPVAASTAATTVGEAGLGELAGRDVDADPARRVGAERRRATRRPARTRSRRIQRAELDDQAVALGDRDEVGRARSRPRSGWSQRTSASTATSPAVRAAPRSAGRPAGTGRSSSAGAQLGAEPGLLGGALVQLGVVAQLAGRRRSLAAYIATSARRSTSTGSPVPVAVGDADAGRRRAARARRRRPARCSAAASRGDDASASAVGGVRQQDGELVAAQPGHQRRRAAAPSRSRSADRDEQLVADGVAEPVVDRLEVVEVEQRHLRPRRRASRAGSRCSNRRRLARPVRSSRMARSLELVGLVLHLADEARHADQRPAGTARPRRPPMASQSTGVGRRSPCTNSSAGREQRAGGEQRPAGRGRPGPCSARAAASASVRIDGCSAAAAHSDVGQQPAGVEQAAVVAST